MSFWSGGFSAANISSPDKYFFITSEASEKGFFRVYYAESVRTSEKEISKLDRGVVLTAIPKELINNLNPAKDFLIKVKLSSNHESVHNFSEIPLGFVLTNDTLKYPEYLSHAIISAGEPCLDLGKEILIISSGMCIPKFTDPEVMNKLNKALNDVIFNASRVRGSDFILARTPAKEGSSEPKSDITVTVTISLSAEAKEKFTGKSIGSFKLPELPKLVSIDASSSSGTELLTEVSATTTESPEE